MNENNDFENLFKIATNKILKEFEENPDNLFDVSILRKKI